MQRKKQKPLRAISKKLVDHADVGKIAKRNKTSFSFVALCVGSGWNQKFGQAIQLPKGNRQWRSA
jgi:hypothetical protein